jgi:hypothetical protein
MSAVPTPAFDNCTAEAVVGAGGSPDNSHPHSPDCPKPVRTDRMPRTFLASLNNFAWVMLWKRPRSPASRAFASSSPQGRTAPSTSASRRSAMMATRRSMIELRGSAMSLPRCFTGDLLRWGNRQRNTARVYIPNHISTLFLPDVYRCTAIDNYSGLSTTTWISLIEPVRDLRWSRAASVMSLLAR